MESILLLKTLAVFVGRNVRVWTGIPPAGFFSFLRRNEKQAEFDVSSPKNAFPCSGVRGGEKVCFFCSRLRCEGNRADDNAIRCLDRLHTTMGELSVLAWFARICRIMSC